MDSFFIEALDFREHPIKQLKPKIQAEYFTALSYIVEKVTSEVDNAGGTIAPKQNIGKILETVLVKKYVSERMNVYRNSITGTLNDLDIPNLSSWLKKPWRKKCRFILICDVALLLLDKKLIERAIKIIQEGLSSKLVYETDMVVSVLFNGNKLDDKYDYIAPLIHQYRLNADFLQTKERRIVVTANMSAGKSTLINALIGKAVARTSQEVCTGNICYLFNKAFEDNNVHLITSDLTLKASAEELHDYEWRDKILIASHFMSSIPQSQRVCIIDTPGVDAALYKTHSSLTHEVLLNEKYDTLLYVVCPTKLGTDAEKKHLQWIFKNITDKKILFILNKLDDCRSCSDNIEESVEGLKRDLLEIGFENPIICPLSAYFSYLLKMKIAGEVLSDDEEDEFAYLKKKFMRSSYDLSHYYENIQFTEKDSEEVMLCKRVGLQGLEKIIYGG